MKTKSIWRRCINALVGVRVRVAGLAAFAILLTPLTAHAASITLMWNASSGTVAGYVVCFGQSAGVACGDGLGLNVGNQTTYTVSGLASGTRYYFVVKAYSINSTVGLFSRLSNEINGLPGSVLTFTDHPLTPGVHAMRSLHITELRTRIALLRAANGLVPATWTDPTVGVGSTRIKAVHITELRAALNAVYTKKGQTPPTYADPTLTAGSTAIKATHIAQLRTFVQAVE